MLGTATVTKMPRKNSHRIETITVSPDMAVDLLEHNKLNRPLNDQHVKRIANQITQGLWRFNGDTIKVADTGDVLDGQHRLWAIIEAKKPINTILVHGIERDAFSTIDTLRKPRSGADILALNGVSRYRNIVASALAWLLRFQRGTIVDHRAPQNKIENSDIEKAFVDHPTMCQAVERAMSLKRLANPSIIGCMYYVLTNRDPDIAERMINTLDDPSAVPVTDPFFILKYYFTSDHHKNKDPVMTFALIKKACNAAKHKRKIKSLSWKQQGKAAEKFPTLEF